jgi:hypothetical protein
MFDSWKKVEELERECPYSGGPPGKWVFRGQGDFCWALKPSLSRLLEEVGLRDPDDPDHVARAVQAEEAGVRAFQMAQGLKADQREWILWWALAQHYGGATRILDWSGEPGVAVYFAARSHLDTNGAVFALDTSRIERCSSLDNSDRSDEGWIRQQEILRTGTPRTIHWCRARTHHIRLQVQDCWFTTCTNVLAEQEAVIKANWPDALKKYTVPSVSKLELLVEAAVRGCSGLGLFSDSSGKSGYAQREQVILHAKRRGACHWRW